MYKKNKYVDEQERRQKENFASRVETLTILFNRFIDKSSNILDGYSAIVFTQPITDALLGAVMQLETFEETKRIDDLLNSALKKKD